MTMVCIMKALPFSMILNTHISYVKMENVLHGILVNIRKLMFYISPRLSMPEYIKVAIKMVVKKQIMSLLRDAI